MRPRKEVWLYHPDSEKAHLLLYVMETRMLVRVHLITLKELKCVPSSVSALIVYRGDEVKIIHPSANLKRVLSQWASTASLLESLRNVIARRGSQIEPKPPFRSKETTVHVRRLMELTSRRRAA